MLEHFKSPEQVNGEICFVIDAAKCKTRAAAEQDLETAKNFLEDLKDSDLSNKDKSQLLVKYFDINKNTAYDLVLNEGE